MVSAALAAERPTTATGSAQSAITRNFAPGGTRTGRPIRCPMSRTDFRRDCVVISVRLRAHPNASNVPAQNTRPAAKNQGRSGPASMVVVALLMECNNMLRVFPNSWSDVGRLAGRAQIVVERVALLARQGRLRAEPRPVAADRQRAA